MPARTKSQHIITKVTFEIVTPVPGINPEDVGAASGRHVEVWANAQRDIERLPGFLPNSMKVDAPKMDKR